MHVSGRQCQTRLKTSPASGRQCQTRLKTSPAPSVAPWCQVHGISFEGFPRRWQRRSWVEGWFLLLCLQVLPDHIRYVYCMFIRESRGPAGCEKLATGRWWHLGRPLSSSSGCLLAGMMIMMRKHYFRPPAYLNFPLLVRMSIWEYFFWDARYDSRWVFCCDVMVSMWCISRKRSLYHCLCACWFL